jgi:hypothetical protein
VRGRFTGERKALIIIRMTIIYQFGGNIMLKTYGLVGREKTRAYQQRRQRSCRVQKHAYGR